MKLKRMYHCMRLLMYRSSVKRAEYLKRHNIFGYMGENCRWGPWKVPLNPKLIRMHDNVIVHKSSSLITHDMLNMHLKNMYPSMDFGHRERIGCIELMDNVYISTRVIVMPDVRINKNCIISAMSVVKNDIPENTIASGNPAVPIGKTDMFAALRRMRKGLTVSFKNQELPDDVAKTEWERFEKRREEK